MNKEQVKIGLAEIDTPEKGHEVRRQKCTFHQDSHGGRYEFNIDLEWA